MDERSSKAVPEVGLATEQLHIGRVEIARADRLVRQAIHVLEHVQSDHEPRRQTRAADPVGVEDAEGGFEAAPVDQLGQAHEGMA
jgi:hypothetical protein